MAEVVDFADAGLESLFLYVRALRAKLDANKPVPETVRVGEFVELAYVKLAKQGEGAIELATDGGSVLTSGHTGVGGGGKPASAPLSGVIERLNRQFHTEFEESHRVAVLQPVIDELVADPQLRQSAQVNDEANFALSFDPRASDALADRHEQHEGFVEQVLGNERVREFLLAEIRREVYAQLRGGG